MFVKIIIVLFLYFRYGLPSLDILTVSTFQSIMLNSHRPTHATKTVEFRRVGDGGVN